MSKTLEQLLEENLLPEDLSSVEPFKIIERWLDEATSLNWQANPNAMVLSTLQSKNISVTETKAQILDNDTKQKEILVPDSRVVLCKGINTVFGFLSFYTNYQSAKGQQLLAQPFASVVMHWDNLGRQVRVNGYITKAPTLDSENYFATRHPLSRLGAWASNQSQPISSRQQLLTKLEAEKKRFAEVGDDIPRPTHWGGYRLWADKIECWIAHPGRIHDRAIWTRNLVDRNQKTGPEGEHEELHFSAWNSSRLQP